MSEMGQRSAPLNIGRLPYLLRFCVCCFELNPVDLLLPSRSHGLRTGSLSRVSPTVGYRVHPLRPGDALR